jgi:FixJ family two-component response regulator
MPPTCGKFMTRLSKVAVVDDDDGVRNSLLYLLEFFGYDAIGFPSAVDFLASDMRAVQCLILDQQMPEMTGLQLTAKLKANGTSIPILLMTGSPSPEITAQAAQLGLSAVPEKPLRDEDILTFLDETFSK